MYWILSATEAISFALSGLYNRFHPFVNSNSVVVAFPRETEAPQLVVLAGFWRASASLDPGPAAPSPRPPSATPLDPGPTRGSKIVFFPEARNIPPPTLTRARSSRARLASWKDVVCCCEVGWGDIDDDGDASVSWGSGAGAVPEAVAFVGDEEEVDAEEEDTDWDALEFNVVVDDNELLFPELDCIVVGRDEANVEGVLDFEEAPVASKMDSEGSGSTIFIGTRLRRGWTTSNVDFFHKRSLTTFSSALTDSLDGSRDDACSRSAQYKTISREYSSAIENAPFCASASLSRSLLAWARRNRALTFDTSSSKTVVQSLSASWFLCQTNIFV